MPRYKTLVLDEEQAAKLHHVLRETVQLCHDLNNPSGIPKPNLSEVDEAALHDEAKLLLEELELADE